MTAKHPSDSKTVVTDMVLPGETNAINTLFGGELLARMDRAASITSQRHSEKVVVTAGVFDNAQFEDITAWNLSM